jgi:hypothetical protein
MNSELYYSKCLKDLHPDIGQHDDYHDFTESRSHILDITPEVDPDGLCDGYERQQKETPKKPFLKPHCCSDYPPHNYVPGSLPYGRL